MGSTTNKITIDSNGQAMYLVRVGGQHSFSPPPTDWCTFVRRYLLGTMKILSVCAVLTLAFFILVIIPTISGTLLALGIIAPGAMSSVATVGGFLVVFYLAVAILASLWIAAAFAWDKLIPLIKGEDEQSEPSVIVQNVSAIYNAFQERFCPFIEYTPSTTEKE